MIRHGRKQTDWQPYGCRRVLHPWPVERFTARHKAGARCVNSARRDLCGVPGNGYPYRDIICGGRFFKSSCCRCL